MIKKCTSKLTLLASCLVTCPIFAGGPDAMHAHDSFDGGLGVGVIWTQYGGYGLNVSYTDDKMTASLYNQVAYQNNSFGLPNSWFWTIGTEIGLRNRLSTTNLFLKYGGGFHFGYSSNQTTSRNTFDTGPFVGLDYQPLAHLMISASVYPFSYEKNTPTGYNLNFFEDGGLSMSYIF